MTSGTGNFEWAQPSRFPYSVGRPMSRTHSRSMRVTTVGRSLPIVEAHSDASYPCSRCEARRGGKEEICATRVVLVR